VKHESVASVPQRAGRSASERADRAHRRRDTLAWGTVAVVVAVTYAVAARLSLVFVAQPEGIAVLWPPAGLAAAALISAGRGRRLAVLAGVAIAVGTANLTAGVPPLASAGFTLANTFEPVLIALALERAGSSTRLDTLRSVYSFALAAIAAPAVAAVIGAGTATLVLGAPFPRTWLTWWVADSAGILAVAPLILCAPAASTMGSWRRRGEGIVVLGLLLAASIVTFLVPGDDPWRRLSFPAFPLLAWAAIRFGSAGAALAIGSAAAIAVSASAGGLGPFATDPSSGVIGLLRAQIFVGIMFVTTFTISAAVAERDARAEELVGHEAEARARSERLTRMTAVARTMSATLDPDDLAIKMTGGVAHVIGCDIALAYLLDPTTGRYVVRSAHGAPAAMGREIEPGDGLTGRAIEAGLVLRDNAYGVERRSAGLRDVATPGTLAVAAVPLRHDEQTIGAVTVARSDLSRPFSDEEVLVLTSVGDLCTLALHNATLHATVSRQAVHDHLTGLPNRYYFDLAFHQMAAQRERTPPDARLAVSAILFDLDYFGDINKERGHQTGDEVLRAVGTLIGERLRRADISARYGGEEFVAILIGTARDEALAVANQIREQLAALELRGLDGELVHVTLSAGVASVGPGESDLDALIGTADVALAMAKRAGRNRALAA
jgi:diguanylate cyclase (GGDEF)-like protein